jgi:hypothetical protein
MRFEIKRIQNYTKRNCTEQIGKIVKDLPEEFYAMPTGQSSSTEHFYTVDDLHLSFIRWSDGTFEGYACPMVDGRPDYETLLCDFKLQRDYEIEVNYDQLSFLLMDSKTLTTVKEKRCPEHFGWREALCLLASIVIILLGAVVLR